MFRGPAGQEGLVLRQRLRAELPWPFLLGFSRWMCVRARFAEDIVEQAVAGGVRQCGSSRSTIRPRSVGSGGGSPTSALIFPPAGQTGLE